MQALLRLTAIVLVVAVPLTLWVLGLRFVSIPSGFREAARSGEEVERLEQALKRREQARRQAVYELLSQRCTLTQTLQQFQELNREWPDLSALARIAGAEESEEEIAYRLILVFIKMAVSGRSEESAEVLRRLENDYQQFKSGRL